MVKCLRLKFRGDLDYTNRLNRFAKKAQASWKGRLQSLFCTVLDVQMSKRFRKHGDPANLARLQAKWARSWAVRLSSSRGRVMGEVDQCFEQLAVEASNEQRELQELENPSMQNPLYQVVIPSGSGASRERNETPAARGAMHAKSWTSRLSRATRGSRVRPLAPTKPRAISIAFMC